MNEGFWIVMNVIWYIFYKNLSKTSITSFYFSIFIAIYNSSDSTSDNRVRGVQDYLMAQQNLTRVSIFDNCWIHYIKIIVFQNDQELQCQREAR